MRRSGRCALIGALVVLLTGATAVGVGAQASGGPLQGSDVGITPTTLRVGVLADVDNAAEPGLFQGSVSAVQGWARDLNAHGGLAGRKVVVDFIDTHLSDTDARNAIIQACQQDFALVGTSALFVNNVDDLVGCKDQAGQPVGLPDFPVVQTEPVHQCSPVSFSVEGETLDCATMNDHPQTYLATVGTTRYFLSHFKDLHGIYVYPSDLLASKNAQVPLFKSQQALGIKADQEFDISGAAPQSAFTPVVQAAKNDQSTYARAGLAASSMVELRREAIVQGLTSVKVWDCSIQCYDRRFIQQGGTAVEGQYVYTTFVPFAEANTNAMMRTYLQYTGVNNADAFGANAWAAGIFFRDVVNDIVQKDGKNGVTRAAVLATAATIHNFTADGMLGQTDVGRHLPTPCFALLQVRGGKFVRVYPTKPGTFDCNPKNINAIKLDLL
jgi:Periplasmic binding protein